MPTIDAHPHSGDYCRRDVAATPIGNDAVALIHRDDCVFDDHATVTPFDALARSLVTINPL